jgi:hypothetical protein
MRISQREARRLKKRVAELEQAERRRRLGLLDYRHGTHLVTFDAQTHIAWIVKTARDLGHAAVLVFGDGGRLEVYGVKHPSEPV